MHILSYTVIQNSQRINVIISDIHTTKQVAEMAGVHRDTLLRWLREGRIAEPK
ncbi:MAG: helix-turn-helix domain-containing protein, partial [Pseudanabaena sp.]